MMFFLSYSVNFFSYENLSCRLEKIKKRPTAKAKIIRTTIENTVDKIANNNFKKFILKDKTNY